MSKKNIALIFPGQGAFGPAMHQLNAMNLIPPLQQYVASKKPFIGICLGFQLLFNGSSESEKDAGLNCLEGYFNRFSDKELSIPHMGWNTVHATNTNTILDEFNNERFYFVHSYEFDAYDTEEVVATTDHGKEIVAAIAKDNIAGLQFHPEKSQNPGLKVIRNFIEWDPMY